MDRNRLLTQYHTNIHRRISGMLGHLMFFGDVTTDTLMRHSVARKLS